MARFETTGRHTLGYLPAWLPSVVGGEIRRGIESQPSDDGVSVTIARVDRDPSPAAAFAEVAKLGGADG